MVYVFNNAQATWERIFSQDGVPYERAKLVLYRDAVDTGCGSAGSAVGPFYCPSDERVYIDRERGEPADCDTFSADPI